LQKSKIKNSIENFLDQAALSSAMAASKYTHSPLAYFLLSAKRFCLNPALFDGYQNKQIINQAIGQCIQ